MAPLHVVHVVVAGEVGGAERMLAELASRPSLTRTRTSIVLFTPAARLAEHFAYYKVRVVDRGRVRENPAAYLWRSLGPSDVRWLSDVLAREKASMVHLHTFGSQVLGTRAAIRCGIPIVRTEHSARVYTDPSCWPFSRWSLLRSDLIIAVSEHTRGVVLRRAGGALPTRVDTIWNGVDCTRFSPRVVPRASEAFRYVLIGRLEPRKGVDRALHALAKVPSVTLDVVGDGEERGKLERLATALGVSGRVRWLGHLEDPRPAIAAADAVLSSSRTEALSLALLEGMAMGKGVVAPPVGGIPEIVVRGESGWLADEDSVDALAVQMDRVGRDRDAAAAMGASARAWVERKASVETMCRAYGNAYERLHAEVRGRAAHPAKPV